MSIPLISTPAADEHFKQWLLAQSSRDIAPLSVDAATPYRYVWQSWITWLDEHHPKPDPMNYLRATSDDVVAFLSFGPAASASKRKGPSTPISRVTRARYGWLLRELYQFACIQGFIELNPVHATDIGPTPTSREQGGQALPPVVLNTLLNELQNHTPTGEVLYQLRNKALMLALLSTGMRSEELRNLRLNDLTRNKAGQYQIQIRGERTAQNRSVATQGIAGIALHRWLQERAALPQPTEPWVFLSKRRGQLTHTAIYRIVAPWLQHACESAGLNVPNHIGPGTLRNTIMVQAARIGPPEWDNEAICRQFGLDSTESLLRNLGHHLHGVPSEGEK